MADRFFQMDVQFMHKRTTNALHDKFGWAGVVTWISLLAAAKTSSQPGTFIYENEAIGWAKLGFDGRTPDFALEDFFRATGHLKQTRKTRSGDIQHVEITQYGRWQNDRKRYLAAARQARHRAKNREDSSVTVGVTPSVTDNAPISISKSISTPKPPSKDGKPPEPFGSWCHECSTRLPPGISLNDHLYNTHGIDTEAA